MGEAKGRVHTSNLVVGPVHRKEPLRSISQWFCPNRRSLPGLGILCPPTVQQTALATEIIGGSGKIIDFNATAVRQAGGGMIQSADDGGDGL